jgi:uncharacterized protein (TIGR02145 family)
MKNIFRIAGLILISVCIQSCKKEVNKVIQDADGNVYTSVTIGEQEWMVENLKTTKYNNGDAIQTTDSDISDESAPEYQWAYAGDESNVATYGRLYTWYTVKDSRNICPVGWHVPTDDAWTKLTDYLINHGYAYKVIGTDISKSMAAASAWNTYDQAGTVGNDQASNNHSGFSAVPGGIRLSNGSFSYIGQNATWWSYTPISDTYAYNLTLTYSLGYVIKNSYLMNAGYSVRCMRD